ncbi:uncharacterized protein METZ01_LOCUS263344 [marine metagenome]|uniref:Uncharacterized protein n=1 Tax=marine metagenome TaxID=408172 RepID=A0A382JEB4_9ZZZZ
MVGGVGGGGIRGQGNKIIRKVGQGNKMSYGLGHLDTFPNRNDLSWCLISLVFREFYPL